MATTEETKAAEAAKVKAEANAKAVEEEGAKATEEARRRDEETLRQQAEAQPYPSQEEADRMKVASATGSAPYVTRDAKAK